jgi:hypothetical protein
MNEVGRHTISYSELPDIDAASPLYEEWNTYRREVARLLVEGKEGKFETAGGGDQWDWSMSADSSDALPKRGVSFVSGG